MLQFFVVRLHFNGKLEIGVLKEFQMHIFFVEDFNFDSKYFSGLRKQYK